MKTLASETPTGGFAAVLAVLVTSVLVGCTTDASAPAVMPPEVYVATPIMRTVSHTESYPAVLEAIDRVVLHAQVPGYLKSIGYEQGALVREGDLLFEIDSRVYEAQLADAEASLRMARAQAELAVGESERAKRLFDRNATSLEEVERRAAHAVIADTKKQEAEATLQMAKLNLEFATIRAPFDGRIGRANVTPGNLVTPADALAVLVGLDKLHVRFDVDENDFARFSSYSESQWTVSFSVPSSPHEPRSGRVTIRESEIEAGTGTLRIRAEIANPNHDLLPGMFGTADLVLHNEKNALLIDEKAIGTMRGQRYVLIVNDENVLEPRMIDLGGSYRGMRSIEQGISAEDRVVVNGLMRAWPGMVVAPVDVSMPAIAANDSISHVSSGS